MKQKATLKEIAEMNHTSVSTVYNALHSSRSIDPDLKARILDTAQMLNYFCQTKKSEISLLKCRIAAIIPSNPIYFWSEARKGIQEAINNKDICLKMFVYTNIDTDNDFLFSLEQAKEMHPDAYIIVPPCSESSKRAISNLSKPVVFLNEYLNVETGSSTGFIGADAYSDGQLFAIACRDFLRKYPRILIVHGDKNNYMVQKRKQGFCDYLPADSAVVGEIRQESSPVMAAKMAQRIKKEYVYKENILKFDCIFVATGLVPQVCLTLKKLNFNVPCIGCEKPRTNSQYIREGFIYGELVQSIREQGDQSVSYALRMINEEETKNKSITIPSNIYIYEKK